MLSKLCKRFKPISISLSPNTERDDVWLAFRLIFKPWEWKRGKWGEELEREFRRYLGVKYAFSFNSGRSALMAILDSLELPRGSEVFTQAFTCNAAVNPIFWVDLDPVYVDCDLETFTMSTEDLKKKISPKSKVVIVQHTFGLPADMDELGKIAQQNNLILIEDCAHALGAEYRGKKVGTFGKAAFFSFSRDKIISCVYGGMVTTNDDVLAQNLKRYQEKIGCPSSCWILQQLLHPVLMNWAILPTYRFLGFGKMILIVSQWLHILSKAVHWKEKRGIKPSYFPKRLPNVLAQLALYQLRKLDRFYAHRKELADFYEQALQGSGFTVPSQSSDTKHSFLRFSVRHSLAHDIIKKAWQQNILLGDWYTNPIAPPDTQLDKVQYTMGSCKNAELLAKTTLNLPTNITISRKQAQKIVQFLLSYENKRNRK